MGSAIFLWNIDNPRPSPSLLPWSSPSQHTQHTQHTHARTHFIEWIRADRPLQNLSQSSSSTQMDYYLASYNQCCWFVTQTMSGLPSLDTPAFTSLLSSRLSDPTPSTKNQMLRALPSSWRNVTCSTPANVRTHRQLTARGECSHALMPWMSHVAQLSPVAQTKAGCPFIYSSRNSELDKPTHATPGMVLLQSTCSRQGGHYMTHVM